jgi:chemotaxis family two-component system sensor kinase Cph1
VTALGRIIPDLGSELPPMNDLSSAEPRPQLPDLTACEREPIHIPGAIEPNGAMLVLREDTLTVLQVSSNALPFLNMTPEALLGMRLRDLFSQEAVYQLLSGIEGDGKRHYIANLPAKSGAALDALVHRYEGLLIVELEPGSAGTAVGPDILTSLSTAMAEFQGPLSLADLCQRITIRIRTITGFDRVMVYRFLEDDTGCVIAEDKRDDIFPYLGLRYPASDIPAQARRLYLLNTLRLKGDVNAPVATLEPPVNPVTGAPLDMTYCVLRAMSPVHVEYLRNMGVGSSMSISIVKDGKLWGLIACHHGEAKIVAQPTRITCEALAGVFSSHIAMAEEQDGRAQVTALLEVTARIEERMRKDRDVVAALSVEADNVAAVVGATGCAFIIRGEIVLLGTTPTRLQVEGLSTWLSFNQSEHVFSTERISAVYEKAKEFDTVASGLLSLRISLGSPDFILWFRPSITQVITWAGDPEKPVEKTGAGERISPRRSFAKWQQTFHGNSARWSAIDRSFAAALRPVIAETLFLGMNEEVLRLNLELARSNADLSTFAHSASHDLQAPVRTIAIYAQLVAKRAGPNMEPESRRLLATIEDAAARMGSLITGLLDYSQIGGIEQARSKPVNLEHAFDRALVNLDAEVRQTGAIVTHDALPVVLNDDDHMMQIFQNLIGNSIKYRGEDTPRIHVSAVLQKDEWLLCVRDNGQGFDASSSTFIFEPFKRLHSRDVPGNGIGLATCKKIVELSKGRIWAESEGKGKGAAFWFTLPAASDQYKLAGL